MLRYLPLLFGRGILFAGLLLVFSSTCAFSTDGSSGGPRVDLFSGSLNYSVPIEVSPGRNGMQPNLELSYNSGRRNGWLGVGWDLSVGSIQRNTKGGLDYNGNEFLFNGMELVEIVPGEYRAKVENGFNRILQQVADDGRITWEVTDKTGKRYLYGQIPESRQAHPVYPDRIFKWCLDKVIDTHGNYMTYSYIKDQGQIYLDQIDYAGNATEGVQPTNYVKFYWEGRDDAPPVYMLKFPMVTAKRLKTVDVVNFSGAGNINRNRVYALEYDADLNVAGEQYSASSKRSLLAKVIEFGQDAQVDGNGSISNNADPFVTVFSWLNQNDHDYKVSSSLNFDANRDFQTLLPADINGDGKTDLINQTGTDGVACGAGQVGVYMSNGQGFDPIQCTGFDANRDARTLLPADINGDGKTDLVYQAGTYGGNCGAGQMGVYMSNGQGFDPIQCTGFDANRDFQTLLPADINGDGKTDLINQTGTDGVACGAGQVGVYMSNGQGFDPIQCAGFDANRDFQTLLPADINGDGKTDLINQAGTNGGTCGAGQVGVYMSNGQGFDPIQCTGFDANRDVRTLRTADINGDGMSDLIYQAGTVGGNCGAGQVGVYMSNGQGFEPIQCTGFDANRDARTLLPADINGDGMSDLIYQAGTVGGDCGAGQVGVYMSNGQGFEPIQCTGFDANRDARTLLPADINGDGKSDLIYQPGTNGGNYGAGVVAVYKNSELFSDQLLSITTPLGATSNINFTPSTIYENNGHLPYPVQTVSSITTGDGNGVSSTTTYEFSDGYHHVEEREFRGFNYAKVTGPLGPNGERSISETWFHQGADVLVDSTSPESVTNNPKVKDAYTKGRPYWQRMTNEAGQVLSETTTSYTEDSGGVPFFTPLAQVDSSLCDGDGVCGLKARVRYDFDHANGNLLTEYRDGDVSTDADDSRLAKTYAKNPSNNILALLATETLFDGSGTQKSHVDYYYDGPSDCSAPATSQVPVKGELSRIVRWLDVKTAGTPVDAEARMGYDAYGNLLCSRDANGNKSTTVYDTTNTFPIKEIDPLLNEVVTSYYGVDGVATDKGLYGQVKAVVDPNGASTTSEYDTFGRKTLEVLSDGSWQSWAYNDFGTLGAQHIYTTNSFGLWTESYFDGLGRTIKERSHAADGKVAVTLSRYDVRGKVRETSLPYFEGLASPQYVTTSFDAAGRPTQVSKPDGSSGSFCYNDGVTVSIDANQHRRRETRDAFGNLVKVEEYLGEYTSCDTTVGTVYATTNYTYDILGNLRFVTDAKGNQTEMRYDSLGRKTYMDDPDMGIWTYDYDPKGNLVYQRDAKAQVVRFSYDALDRITLKDYAAASETDITYVYDEGGHGFAKGKLTSMVDGSGSTSYAYNDPLDRSVTLTKSYAGEGSYSITTITDALGRTDSILYPDNKVAGYNYLDGQLSSVVYDGATYATYTGYNAQGQFDKASYGNGVVTDYSYEPDSYMLLTARVSKGATTLLDSDYVYDNKGNITDIFNYADPAKSQTFGYDELDRLKTAESGIYGALAYSYDEIGNFKVKEGRTHALDPDRPHATASTYVENTYQTGGGPEMIMVNLGDSYYPVPTGNTLPVSTVTSQNSRRDFAYDANGNMLSDGSRTFVWNADNKPASITSGTTAVSYVYDGTGQRVKKIGNNGSVLYLGQHCEISDGTVGKYIFANGRRLALVRETLIPLDVLYYHQDHLGSTGVVTDSLGNKVEDIFYKPFGEAVSDVRNVTETSVNHKFTGQELDQGIGLYNYNARMYDPVLGKFISADKIVPDPVLPQAFNRYAYCVNNPLLYVDPSGHSFWENLINPLDPVSSWALNKSVDFAHSQQPDWWSSISQGIHDGYRNSVSPGIAIDNGGAVGGLAWITGGTATYSYNAGWGAHAGGAYWIFFGSMDWQERGYNSGLSATGGVGYSKGPFVVGGAVSYNFKRRGKPSFSLMAGVQGKGWSGGISYNVTSQKVSGYSNISLGEMSDFEISTTSGGGRQQVVMPWNGGLNQIHITGFQKNPTKWGGEGHWLTVGLDMLSLHPIAAVHDHWAVKRNLPIDAEFIGSMLPSGVIGRVIAGPQHLSPHAFGEVKSW